MLSLKYLKLFSPSKGYLDIEVPCIKAVLTAIKAKSIFLSIFCIREKKKYRPELSSIPEKATLAL